MQTSILRIGARVLAAATFSTIAASTTAWSQAVSGPTEVLTVPNGKQLDGFGRMVMIEGDNMVITASAADQKGAAYAYRRIAGVWTPKQKFTGSTTSTGDNFGFRADMDGDRIAVGAYWDDDLGFDSGSVFVFEFNGTAWVQTALILAPDGDANDGFGSSVALSGDVLVVGASADEPSGVAYAGSAYVFRLTAGAWTFEQKLTHALPEVEDQFGWDVAIDGTTLLSSCIQDKEGALKTGAIYSFDFDGTTWNQTQRFVASNGGDNDYLGWDMALEGSRAAIGAPNHNGTGAVYVFERQGGVWTETDKLVSAVTTGGDSLGWSVALEYPRILAGAPGKAGIPPSPAGFGDGAVFQFNFNGLNWADAHHWVSGDVSTGGFFLPQLGSSVALDGPTAVGGATFGNGVMANTGKAYRFDAKPIGFQAQSTPILGGQNASFDIYGGSPGAPYGIALVGINGAPYPLLMLTQANLDSNGEAHLALPAPVAFVGMNFQLISGAIWQLPGQVGLSNQITVTIQ